MLARSSYNLLFVAQGNFVTNFLQPFKFLQIPSVDGVAGDQKNICFLLSSFDFDGRYFGDHVGEAGNIPIGGPHTSVAGV